MAGYEHVDSDALELGPLTQVSNKASILYPNGIPAFNHEIRYYGERLYLYTNNHSMDYLCYRSSFRGSGRGVVVPVDEYLRYQLNTLETFVRQKVKLPKELVDLFPKKDDYYKYLYQGVKMTIPISKFCVLYRGVGVKPEILSKDNLPSCGAGNFRFKIEIEKVYIGPHINGELFSLNMRVVAIDFIPQCDIPTNELVLEKPCKQPQCEN